VAGEAGLSPVCHAPASAAKSATVKEKVLESWDRLVALSRASLERQMRVILRDLDDVSGRTEAVTAAMSRASLGPEAGAIP